MFKTVRHVAFTGLLAGSVGVPYLVATGHKLDSIREWWNRPGSSASVMPGFDGQNTPSFGLGADPPPVMLPGELPVTREFAPPQQLPDVFRFEITIDWIMTHWPTVSSVTSDPQMQGFRVPLVTGINENDVAGSLTYYFGPDRQLQRITLEGTTGNADKLISQVATPYGLVRRQSGDNSVFLYQRVSSGKPVSELRIHPADVITISAPHRRFQISLVLTRPVADGWF